MEIQDRKGANPFSATFKIIGGASYQLERKEATSDITCSSDSENFITYFNKADKNVTNFIIDTYVNCMRIKSCVEDEYKEGDEITFEVDKPSSQILKVILPESCLIDNWASLDFPTSV